MSKPDRASKHGISLAAEMGEGPLLLHRLPLPSCVAAAVIAFSRGVLGVTSEHWPATTGSRIQRFAREAGFDLCGISPVREFRELEYLPRWITEGNHGEMKYMEACDDKGKLKRASLSSVAPWARSVIVCAINYNTSQPYSTQANDPTRGWISRYAWGREDYHDGTIRRLRKVEAKLHELIEETESCPSPTAHRFRSYVDTGPLVERVYAKYAGIGWIGKNTCIINQKIGSWLFLGVILTSLELEPSLPAPDRCGTCTRCLDACPTDAFLAPGKLDARRCISYLTIEKRGEIAEDLRSGMGRHVFGCDICQDVCPWNRKASVTNALDFQPRESLVNPALEWLAEMQQEEFRRVFRESPIRRTKLSGLRRNAVIGMGNSGNRKFLPTLKRLAEDLDQAVAEAARWAGNRLIADRSKT